MILVSLRSAARPSATLVSATPSCLDLLGPPRRLDSTEDWLYYLVLYPCIVPLLTFPVIAAPRGHGLIYYHLMPTTMREDGFEHPCALGYLRVSLDMWRYGSQLQDG